MFGSILHFFTVFLVKGIVLDRMIYCQTCKAIATAALITIVSAAEWRKASLARFFDTITQIHQLVQTFL